MEHANVTYKKIAEKLNVSQSTVSKALSGSREISSDLSDKIYFTAKEMGYFTQKRERNREYAKNFSPEIAILVPEIISICYSDLATRFVNEIELFGGRASLYITGFDHENISSLLSEIYDMVHFDGVILLSGCDFYGEVKLPTIAIGSAERMSNFDTIFNDYEIGMREAVKHLLSLGHSKIGFAGELLTLRKEKLFRKILAEEGLSANEDFIFCISERFENIGQAVGQRIAKMKDYPSALIAAYDEIAIGLISSLADHSIRVPEDISVIGINDIPVAKYMNPPLTTIASHTAEKCSIAVDLLMRKIKKNEFENIESHACLSTGLVIRESTARIKK